MRLIKMVGLAAVAAIAAMAFLGASSAMADVNTALCVEESELVCPKGGLVDLFDMTAGTTVLKTSLLTVLCLGSKVHATVENEDNLGHAPEPLLVQIDSLTWENCGSNAEHTNCKVTNIKLPLFDVLKTAEDLGEAVALGAEVHVECSGLNCYYGGAAVEGFEVESALHTGGAGHGMFSALGLPVPKVKGFLCPATSSWTALYEPTEHLWLRS